MRFVFCALAIFGFSGAAKSDDFTGWFFGTGIAAVHSGGSGTVSRTTSAVTPNGPIIIDQTSIYQSASDSGVSAEFTGLYQSRFMGALVGVETTYQYRDFDIETNGSIFSPGAKGVSHIGDRGMIRSRLGLEVMPHLAIYTSNGISYAWENETYLLLANGVKTSRKDTSTWNTVFGGGIEYAMGDFLFDLRFTAAPGKDSHEVVTVNAGRLSSRFETTAASDWTYDLGLRVLYKLNN